jgi:hypothetical protein
MEGPMWRKIVAVVLAFAVPASASAGTLKDAAEKAGRETALQQSEDTRNRGRFWTGVALIGGGAVLSTLAGLEVGDDETGPDDGEDFDDSDDGEDSDGWGNKAMLGGGIAAATLGGVLLITGRRKSTPVVSVQPGGVAVHHTVRF